MKITKKKKHIVAILLLALISLLIPASFAYAEDRADCSVDYVADTSDSVVLSGEGRSETKQGPDGSFSFSFTEPDTYHYTVTDGTHVYNVDIYVLYENDVLVATPVIYNSDLEKNVTIDFVDKQDVSYEVTDGEYGVWYRQTNVPLPFTVHRSVDDETTFSHFTDIAIDGKTVSESMYNAASGSLNVSLIANYLKTLTLGQHDIQFNFDDGSASTKFIIRSKENPDETVYTITSGADAERTKGAEESGLEYTFNPNAAPEKVLIDGTETSPEIFSTAEIPGEGTLVTTVNGDYLDTLTDGQHTVKFVFADGSASTKFTVTSPEPQPVEVSYEITGGADRKWVKDDEATAGVTVSVHKTQPEGDPIGNLSGIIVDGEAVPGDMIRCSTSDPSYIDIEIMPPFLNGLEDGVHEILIQFEDGTVETTVTVEKKEEPQPQPVEVTYGITDGASQTWTKKQNTENGPEITVRKLTPEGDPLGAIVSVEIDGHALTAEQMTMYASDAGSISISLNPGYADALSDGVHTWRVVLSDGEAETTVTVVTKEEPTSKEEPTKEEPETKEEPTTGEEPTKVNPERPTEPVTKPAPEQPTTQPTTQPATQPVTQPATQPVTKPATNANGQPSANAGGKVDPTVAAKTGDENNIILWCTMCGLSLVSAIASMVIVKRKNSKNRKEER